jgi:hypothetical protein
MLLVVAGNSYDDWTAGDIEKDPVRLARIIVEDIVILRWVRTE